MGGGKRRVALVGRERELHGVRAALRDGRPVAIAGADGMGRTELARAALHARSVAWGGGLATLTQRPYVALERALAEEAPDGNAAEVTSWVTSRLNGRSLVVDDLHLVHAATVEVLRRLAGTVPLLVTVASGDRRTAALRRRVEAWPGLHLVEMAPLDRDSAVRLVRQHAPLLGAAEAARLAGAGGPPARLIAVADHAAAQAGRAPALPSAQPYRPSLSPRQSEVLQLIAAGDKTSEIASRLGIAESTVESHVRAIRSKLGAPTRTAAVAWAS